MTTKLKKPIALLLAVTMAMLLNFPSGMFGIDLGIKASAEEITPTEPKTDNGVYEIGTAAELYWFAELVNNGDNSANAVLTANITVNTGVLNSDGTLNASESFTDWTPIGDYGNQYAGTFDGEGHTISGLYFDDGNTNYVGLFGYVGEGGSVSNVGVVDSYFSGNKYVGGVCGNNYGTIKNCYNTGSVSGRGEGVGGVCGSQSGNGSEITNCYNTGSVSGSNDSNYVGGVCGHNDLGTIENCSNSGEVTGRGEGVGGVCGFNFGTITNCYNTGSVNGSNAVGGVCGFFKDGTIENCYNTGSVSGRGEGVGGVCGFNSSNSTITNCYYLAESETDNIEDTTYKTAADFENGNICELVGYHSHQNGICILCGNYKLATLTTDKYDINGDNTKDEVYEISSAGQLYWFAALVNGGITDANAVLTADITVNKDVLKDDGTLSDIASGFTSWTPIGNYDNQYTGTFDGQGHTISGLYFNDANIDYVGLFGYVGSITDENGNVISAGKVSNVGVVDSYFSGSNFVGGVCGDNRGTITNSYNTGTVSGSGRNIGGVCGLNYEGTITNCYNTGSVSGSNYVGGVCGDNHGTITNCYNTGTVSGSSSSWYVGGVCGGNYGTIESCYNTGSVSGSNDSNYVGGVCGINDGTIENCYNTGTVSGSNFVGGVCGQSGNGSEITNCYNTGSVSGSDYVGGVCGFNSSNSTITNCYYLAESETDNIEDTTFKNTTEFASGEVCYLLNGDQSTLLWGQTIGKESGNDAYPVFHKNNTVYYGYADCNATDKTYSNDERHEEQGHKYNGKNHACSYCRNAFATFKVNYAKLANALTDTIYEVKSDGTIIGSPAQNVTVDKDTGVITCYFTLNGSSDLFDTYELKLFENDKASEPLEQTGKIKYKKNFNGDIVGINMMQIVYDLKDNTSYKVKLTLYGADGTTEIFTDKQGNTDTE